MKHWHLNVNTGHINTCIFNDQKKKNNYIYQLEFQKVIKHGFMIRSKVEFNYFNNYSPLYPRDFFQSYYYDDPLHLLINSF